MPELSLTLCRCPHCHRIEPAARLFCAGCGNSGLEPVSVAGAGKLVSWTIVRRPAAAFRDLGQIPVVLVRLDSDVSVTGRMDGPVAGLAPGARMTAVRVCDGVPVFSAIRAEDG